MTTPTGFLGPSVHRLGTPTRSSRSHERTNERTNERCSYVPSKSCVIERARDSAIFVSRIKLPVDWRKSISRLLDKRADDTRAAIRAALTTTQEEPK